MLIYDKFAKIIDAKVATMSNENIINASETSLFEVKTYEIRTPAPIDVNTIMNIRNLNPIFNQVFLRTYSQHLLWFGHTYPLNRVFLLIFLCVYQLFL